MSSKRSLNLLLMCAALGLYAGCLTESDSDDDGDDYFIYYPPSSQNGQGDGQGQQGQSPDGSGQMTGQPGQQPGAGDGQGMNSGGQQLSPELHRYLTQRVEMAKVDCGCSAKDPGVWDTFLSNEQCIDNWTKLLGDEQVIVCQEQAVRSTAMVRDYVACMGDADAALLQCFGSSCPSSYNDLQSCLRTWNEARFLCQRDRVPARIMFEGCSRPELGQDITPALGETWVNMSGTRSAIDSYVSLDNEYADTLFGDVNTSFYIRFTAEGTFRDLVLKSYSGIQEYPHKGVWAPEGGVLHMSHDCESRVPTRYFIAFQRLFLGHYILDKYPRDFGPKYFQRDYAYDELCGG